MKCPIRYNVWVDKDNKPILLDQDCLKEECAWWNGLEGECDFHCFRRELSVIKDTLYKIAYWLAHVEQFKR